MALINRRFFLSLLPATLLIGNTMPNQQTGIKKGQNTNTENKPEKEKIQKLHKDELINSKFQDSLNTNLEILLDHLNSTMLKAFCSITNQAYEASKLTEQNKEEAELNPATRERLIDKTILANANSASAAPIWMLTTMTRLCIEEAMSFSGLNEEDKVIISTVLTENIQTAYIAYIKTNLVQLNKKALAAKPEKQENFDYSSLDSLNELVKYSFQNTEELFNNIWQDLNKSIDREKISKNKVRYLTNLSLVATSLLASYGLKNDGLGTFINSFAREGLVTNVSFQQTPDKKDFEAMRHNKITDYISWTSMQIINPVIQLLVKSSLNNNTSNSKRMTNLRSNIGVAGEALFQRYGKTKLSLEVNDLLNKEYQSNSLLQKSIQCLIKIIDLHIGKYSDHHW